MYIYIYIYIYIILSIIILLLSLYYWCFVFRLLEFVLLFLFSLWYPFSYFTCMQKVSVWYIKYIKHTKSLNTFKYILLKVYFSTDILACAHPIPEEEAKKKAEKFCRQFKEDEIKKMCRSYINEAIKLIDDAANKCNKPVKGG